MERIKRFFVFLILIFAINCGSVFAEPVSLSTLVTPQNVSYETCYKAFNVSSQKLFYLALAAANANRFQTDEIQSKNGYIVFTAVNREFLASVVKLDKNRSMLKITPTNNNYYFPPGIVLNFFRYIELNLTTPVDILEKV